MNTENRDELVLEDDDLLVELSEEEAPEEEFAWDDDVADNGGGQDTVTSRNADADPARDPLSTATLAELYVSQGFLKRAVTIYRELLETEPDNEDLKRRMMELKEAVDRDQISAREHALDDLSLEDAAGPATLNPLDEQVEAGGTDSVLRTLERWLENIGRRR
ncbi:tetratricopeptide repeat protein [Geomobilimonas luticola]|uniref:Tetratricopeptide repeat protein n=1 Tax=Geomobilimonas luticola TaxID=1114878 RepID=A0ABS5SBV6_9BACT|nr:tetratricopeptide repeat protein [Geomobilimonas luticola]MBT0652837.1 tetratricopeptide repeat protein [Geomobilimonas luticola]